MAELIWEGKYDDQGRRRPVERIALPFQVVETVNRSRATREQAPLLAQGGASPAASGWTNKLIWGENKYVLASLLQGDPSIGLEPLAGKVNLIYIDPPFATGQDFSYQVRVGDEEWVKEASIIEETAYRDTWGRGLDSYLQMMYERLLLMRELLAEDGSIYVHVDDSIGPYVRMLLDDIFGISCFINAVIWKRSDAHSDVGQGAKHLGKICDCILYYSRSPGNQTVNMQFTPLPDTTVGRWYRHVEEGTGRRYNRADITGPGGARKGNPVYEWKGITRAWRFSKQRMEELEKEGRIVYSESGMPYLKRYLDDSKGVPLQDLWDDIKMIRGIHSHSEGLDYATQKPQALLERIIKLASNRGDLVADFFCGSGTTMAVAEKLGRRWIGCDLSRYAMQVSRKRLLDIYDCKPFEVLNLGRYERRHWQVNILNGHQEDSHKAITDYLRFIVALYHAEPVGGYTHLHGQKAGRWVHVGAADAPVTRAEIMDAVRECQANRYIGLDVLGWEWEMGLYDTIRPEAHRLGVDLRLLYIPREVMDRRAVQAGDVHFYELAYLKTALLQDVRQVTVKLEDFIIPNPDLVPDEVRSKIKKWSDYIDFWAVDWDYRRDTFHNQWQNYRTRKSPTLRLLSDPHTYSEPGDYRILVKVIDIFGNDTTQLLAMTVP